jgi:hypothetical protein
MAIHNPTAGFIKPLGGAAATWSIAARVQQPESVQRSGVLSTLPRTIRRRRRRHCLRALEEVAMRLDPFHNGVVRTATLAFVLLLARYVFHVGPF